MTFLINKLDMWGSLTFTDTVAVKWCSKIKSDNAKNVVLIDLNNMKHVKIYFKKFPVYALWVGNNRSKYSYAIYTYPKRNFQIHLQSNHSCVTKNKTSFNKIYIVYTTQINTQLGQRLINIVFPITLYKLSQRQ